MKITVLGTGLMGAPMARNLIAGGFQVAVWNRTTSKAECLASAGAHLAATTALAVADAHVVISMLSDGDATATVQADPALRAALRPGMIWIDMCSAKPDQARTQAADLKTLGLDHLDAPVSGGTKGAEDATLAIMVGGDAAVYNRMTPVFQAMGRPVHVGPSGAGQLCKLANQAIVGVTIAAVAEAMLLVKKGGADPAALRAALTGGFADSTILQQHGARMTDGNFDPGGKVQTQVKDLDNILAVAETLALDLPATHAVRDRFADLSETMQGADLDHSALYLELLSRNGLHHPIAPGRDI